MKLTLTRYAKAGYFKFIDFLHRPFVKRSTNDPFHIVYQDFISIGKRIDAPSVLEIGSRNVTGITRRDIFSHYSEYVGFDILPGENVDIVGDVHKLSEYCPLRHFDLVYCMAVFEHFYFLGKQSLKLIK